jgi:hypothetical protein
MIQLSILDASPIRWAGTQYGTIKKIKTRKNELHFVTFCNPLGPVHREGDVAWPTTGDALQYKFH